MAVTQELSILVGLAEAPASVNSAYYCMSMSEEGFSILWMDLLDLDDASALYSGTGSFENYKFLLDIFSLLETSHSLPCQKEWCKKRCTEHAGQRSHEHSMAHECHRLMCFWTTLECCRSLILLMVFSEELGHSCFCSMKHFLFALQVPDAPISSP